MDIKDRIDFIQRNTEEILNGSEINKILAKKNLKVYCGYEPSGEIHLGHLVTMVKLLDFQNAGITPIVLLADWHAWLNKKGDWDFLDKQVKIWEKGMKAAGLTKAKFVKGTNFQRDKNYIDDVMTMALDTTVNRGLRSMQTIARDLENAKISQMIYPLMQIEDIKALDLDFVVAGMDQRKIHALGIELFNKIGMKKKPVFLHTGIIPSLKGPGAKMSSSVKESLISIRDKKESIKEKLRAGYCKPRDIENNAILSITKLIIFPRFGGMTVKRDKKYGGDLIFENYKQLENAFESGKLHALDLKNSMADYLEEIIEPIRKAWK